MSRRLGGAFISRRLLARENTRVIMTHFVSPEDFEQFGRILDCIAKKREWLDPRHFVRAFAEGRFSQDIVGPSLVLTFDDGLLSSYETAQSVLQPRGIRAIFFVPTGILELSTHSQMRDFATERIYYGTRPEKTLRVEEYVTMGAEHLQELQEHGHLILPHTHSHAMARDITSNRDAVLELIQPKMILEDLLGSPIHAFALPVGTPAAVSAFAYRQIVSTYSVCFTALGGANTSATNPHFIRRDSIHPWYKVEHAMNIVDGLYDPYFDLKAKALRRRAGHPRRPSFADASAYSESTWGTGARSEFALRVTHAFQEANVDYVVLHGGRDHGDSDLAVSRRSLDAADAVIRSGALGRMVQCLHYDVPWYRYYVLESEEPGRRHRQIDVACDPWGLGRYGATVSTALSRAVSAGQIRVPAPAAETLYLAAKRARKMAYHAPGGIDDLMHAFQLDPIGAAELLEAHFGSAGRALATSLRNESDAGEELARVRRRLARRRRTPLVLARRAAFSAVRITRRLTRPTGLVVSIVGGTGEASSFLVSGLQNRTAGAFRRTLTLCSDRQADRHGSIGPVALVASLWRDALIHWWPRVPLARARSTLVIVEHGWLELNFDSRRLGSAMPVRTIRLLGRLLPRPDLTICLADSAALTGEHVPHSESAETMQNRGSWQRHPVGQLGRFVLIESSCLADTALERAVAAVDDCLAARHR